MIPAPAEVYRGLSQLYVEQSYGPFTTNIAPVWRVLCKLRWNTIATTA